MTLEEIKKFFRYFFVGGGFVDRRPNELHRFSKPGMNDEVMEKLLEHRVLERIHVRAEERYQVTASFRRPVQKLVNENNLSRGLNAALAEFIGR